MASGVLIEAIQLLIVALGAPLIVGSVRKLKARLQGRRGASVLQPYRDLRKMLVKEAVISENTSWIFRFTPYLVARAFGGPIWWRIDGELVRGTDLYKYQFGGGFSFALPSRALDVFVEGIGLGERGLAAGLGTGF